MNYILFALLFLLTACKSQEEMAQVFEPPAVPAYAAAPSRQDVPIHIESLGTLHAKHVVEVRPRIEGTVAKVFVKEGQWVEEGALLFELDALAYKARVEQAHAELQHQKAILNAAYKKLKRFQTLADKELISKNEWEQIEAEFLQAKAALALYKAKANEQELQLSYCKIYAPKAGRVGKVDIHPGHLATGEALVEIASIDHLEAQFFITEKEFCQLTDATTSFECQLLSAPEKVVAGVISFTDNQFDPRTGQILLIGSIDNKNLELRPGMSVKVRLPVACIQNALLIPAKAVIQNSYGVFVYVVGPDCTAQMRQVKTGHEHKDLVVIVDGLVDEDVVVTDGHMRIAPGAKVAVL